MSLEGDIIICILFLVIVRFAIREFGKMTTAISIVWPDLIGKSRSILLRYSH